MSAQDAAVRAGSAASSLRNRHVAPRPGAAPRAADPLTVTVAALAVALLGLRVQIVNGVTVGLLVGLALSPVWLTKLRSYRGGAVSIALIVGSLMSGLWLTALASTDHQLTDLQTRMWIGLMLTFGTTVGVALWARQFMHDGTVAAVYGFGMLGSSIVNGFSAENAWKFGYSLPLTVMLLGLAWRAGRRWLELALAVGLAAISATNDSRSHFAMVLLAAALVVWQILPRTRTRHLRRSPVGAALVLTTVGIAIYSLGQALILEGYLGEATKVRSEEQIARAGSILLGGRPELGATVALIQHRPFGFGFGTRPTLEDVNVAKTGMTRLGYDPNNGYVENYMFGEGIKLHSIAGDTWALFGVTGLALTCVMLWALVRRLTVDLSANAASALITFLTARLLWDVGFGGFFGSLPVLGVTVGLALLPRNGSTAAPSGGPPAPTSPERGVPSAA